MNFESKMHTDDNVSRLAHLLNQKSLNATLFEKKKIPSYMYQYVNDLLGKKIDELEHTCYSCA